MTTRTLFLPGLLAAASLSGAAWADFTGTHVEDVSEFLGTPPGLATYRVFIEFDDPADQLLAISGNQDVAGFSFSTDAPDGLVNAGGVYSGLKQEDFTWFPIAGAPWDSWVTIGASTFVGNDTDYSPGFAGSDGVHNVIKGTEFSQASNGGWFDSNPSSPEIGGSPLIAQFTIAEGYEFVLEGTVDYYPGGSPPSSSVYFYATNETGPACDTTVEHVFTSPPIDIDGDGATGFQDLLAVLGAWGPCAPDYEITGQDRSSVHGHGDHGDDSCVCWTTRIIAVGIGSFTGNMAHSRVRDDGMSLAGAADSYGTSPCVWSYTSSVIGFSFDVNVPLSFTFFADVQWDAWCCEPDHITLTGPSGFYLSDPVDTSGILAPGHYDLHARLTAPCGGDGEWCDADFDYNLVLEGTRCAADVDRNGVVDWRDLLRVLTWWGPSTEFGACCLPDGSCTEALGYEECLAFGGVVAGWGTWCDTIACPPFVACCLPDGTCTDRVESDCLAAGGTPQGPDTTCAATTCPQPGACCFPEGWCILVTPESCDEFGGTFQGDGSTCETVSCP